VVIPLLYFAVYRKTHLAPVIQATNTMEQTP